MSRSSHVVAHGSSRRSRRRVLGLVALAAALVLAPMQGVAQASTGTGRTITVSVNKPNGLPAEGAPVTLYYGGNGIDYGSTDSQGMFTFNRLSADSFKVGVDQQGFEPWYYNAKTSLDSADPIDLTSSTTADVTANLTRGYSISGHVGLPARITSDQVEVVAYQKNDSGDWNQVSWDASVDSGDYAVGDLSPGVYRVCVDGGGNHGSAGTAPIPMVCAGASSSVYDIGSAADLTIAQGGPNLTGKNISVNPPSVSGTVTDSGGSPVDGASVSAAQGGSSVAQTTTADDGSYTIYAPPGATVLDAQADGYDDQQFNNGTPISLSAGQHLTGKNIQFSDQQQSYTINGKVTGPGGVGLGDVDVTAYDADGNWAGEATTGGHGRYSLDVGDGSYKVEFTPEDYGASAGFPTTWYGGSTKATATPVTITDAASVASGIDVQLPGGTVSGTVTDQSSTPLSGITVTAYRYNADDDYWEGGAHTSTGASGAYTLALPKGDVRVEFGGQGSTADRRVEARFYGASDDQADHGTDVTVADGGAVAGIDGSLSALTKVTGTVTDQDGQPLEDVNVDFYDNGTDFSARTNAVGKYVAWVAPGSYTGTTYLVDYTQDDQSVTVANAPMTVDFTMAAHGVLSGTLDGAGGQPLAGARVGACGANDCESVRTNASGIYRIGVEAGSYTLRFSADGYVSQYYKNGRTERQADPVPVLAGGHDSLDTVTLTQTGSIGGTVKAGTNAIPGAIVRVYAPDRANRDGWSRVGSATTDASGAYVVAGLDPAGTYRVGATWRSQQQFYPAARTVMAGGDVTGVPAGGTKTVSISLSTPYQLTGTVTGGAASAAAANITVTVQRKHADRFGKFSWQSAGRSTTTATGSFDVPVSPGAYRLKFSDPAGHLLTTWYTGGTWSSHQQDAAEINATSAGQSGLDAEMPASDTISGTVTLGGASADGGVVYALTSDGAGGWRYVRHAVIDASGSYTLVGLQAGTYRVEFEVDGAAPAYWKSSGTAGTPDGADDITFTSLNQKRTGISADLSTAPTYALSGKVTQTDGTTGIGDIDVEITRQQPDNTWEYFTDTYTNNDGTFSLDVPTGVYRVAAVSNGVYAGAYYVKDGSGDTATPVTVNTAPVSLANAIKLSPIPSSTVSGTVTKTGGGAVSGASVMLCPSYSDEPGDYDCFDGAASTTTDGSGHYTLTVQDGSYQLLVTADGYVQFDQAVQVSGDQTVNVPLKQAGSVSGTVAGPSGAVDGGFEVDVYTQQTAGSYSYWDIAGYDYVTSGDSYSVTGLPPGTYHVCITAPTGLANECYKEQLNDDPQSATDVSVTAGQPTTIDFGLQALHHLTGTVRDSVASTGLGDVEVDAYAQVGGQWTYFGGAGTEADGSYDLALPGGSYVLALTDEGGDYPYSVYATPTLATDLDHGTPVSVNADKTLDISLVKGAAIAGTVKWPDASDKYGWSTTVSAVDTHSGKVVQTQYVDSSDPYYALMGLEHGTYRLDFARSSTQRLSGPAMTVPEAQFSGGVNEGAGPGGAKTFTLTSGGAPTVANTSATLHNGLVLTGTISDPQNHPLAGCYVTAYTTDGHLVSRGSDDSDASGGYVISGLTNGAYDLQISGDDGGDCNQGTRFLTGSNGATSTSDASLATVAISRNSTNTQNITYGDPKFAAGTVTISGASAGGPVVGTVLTANKGTWTPTPTSFTFQWFADGEPIVGATESTFTPTAAQVGSKLSVTVTGHGAGHSDTDSSSAQTAPVVLPKVVNNAAPTISGSPVPGDTLTASTGTWTPSTGLSFHYAWMSDGKPAVGAADSPTYPVQPGSVGDVITVTVTAHKDGYRDGTATSAGTTVHNAAVTVTGTPTIGGGAATVGQKATGDDSGVTTTPTDATRTYVWKVDGSQVGTGKSYTPAAGDAGHLLTFEVVANKASYATGTADSTAVTIAKGTLGHSGSTAITGTVKVGSSLSAPKLTWTPSDVSLAYQWYRGATAIADATGATYDVSIDDVGQRLKVVTTATDPGYHDATVTSGQTGVVPKVAVSNTAAPTITGTAKVASTLTAHGGTWSPADVTLAYQWLRNGAAIAHATSPTYHPVAADRGKALSVRVTGTPTDTHYAAGRATSAATHKVAAGTITGGTPTISGKAKAGKKLTARPGTTKPSGVIVTYQWLRNGKSIKGATASKYTLTKKDQGTKVSVRVTRTKAGYTTLKKTSKATKIAKPKPKKHKKKH
ncbi:carboxypeptidase regulatory-like domain-containing protein [Nocardioides terrisoli]|uniref:carboxypeptidase regulatory-like domain-containing protein n=1 Tax=Nocardioides terrisoli TaxID=3388267 RepID=UPI00287B8ADF|nr:carboxypeptidase regulatory-like domain-containing protein [Nocardioides marmorisolisilvae]